MEAIRIKGNSTGFRCRIMGAALVAFGMVTAVTFWPEKKEPEYWKQSLSWWVQGAAAHVNELPLDRRYPTPLQANVVEAISHIGTNAVPYLLNWLQHDTPAWRTKLCGVYDKLPSRFKSPSAKEFILDSRRATTRRGVPVAFWCLGPDGSAAIPELVRLARDSTFSADATLCLAGLGAPGVKCLSQLAKDPDAAVSSSASYALFVSAMPRRPAQTNSSSMLVLFERLAREQKQTRGLQIGVAPGYPSKMDQQQ